MHIPVFSYSSFPKVSDTTQIQKETLEKYHIRIMKFMRIVKLLRDGKSQSIFQKLLLIIALLLIYTISTYKKCRMVRSFSFLISVKSSVYNIS